MCLAKMSSAWVRHQKGKPDLGARTGGGGGGRGFKDRPVRKPNICMFTTFTIHQQNYVPLNQNPSRARRFTRVINPIHKVGYMSKTPDFQLGIQDEWSFLGAFVDAIKSWQGDYWTKLDQCVDMHGVKLVPESEGSKNNNKK